MAMAEIYKKDQSNIRDYLQNFAMVDLQLGAIFLINGKVVGMDCFGKTETFEKAFKKIVESFFSSILTGNVVQRFGADHPRLEIVAKVGFFLVLDRIVDSFPAVVGGERIVKTAPSAAFEIGQAGWAVINPGRFALDARILSAIPAAQAHSISFP